MPNSGGIDADSFWRQNLPVLLWYLPAIVAAPFIVALAPLTRLAGLGWGKFIGFNVVLLIGAMLTLQLSAITLTYIVFGMDWGMPNIFAMINYFYRATPWHADLILVFGLFAVGYSLDYSSRLRVQEVKAAKLQTALVNAELQALKSQLNPHFLFNVLNGISGLIRSDRNDEATDALSDLSAMLRTILENRNQEMVPVKKELAFIENYLALQQMRFRDKLQVEISVEDDVLPLKVPFMLMQPLVENAIHHGAQLETGGNLVKIHLQKQEDKLLFTLINKVPEKSSEGGFGIGIGNNKERLRKIYGGNFQLDLTAMDDRYYKTRLLIPFGENSEKDTGGR